ncbi:hypothetical protein [Sinanaerobacter chloroacetimidivorans]|uniref:DUF4367 domain-containing protein n=1 Tax=Sinanaerobacter chloroacetimidivorans TaxID=2818044 RepID=A0A8J7VXE8_9FIRM|nr:hypothetical protein [Sinanaerobacter chloroacetimidivorans]MBR0596819.1 hypothetical protein [Sinanaerobacter chloroacetimidivorans]
MNNNKYEELIGNAIKNTIEEDFELLDFYKDIKYVEPNLFNYNIKKSRGLKYLAIAASVLILCLLSGTLAIIISNGAVSATEFKIEKKLVLINNLFSKGNENHKKYVQDDTIVLDIKDLDEIEKATNFFPDLFELNKVPDRYNFVSLTITKTAKDVYNAIYIYNDNEDKILTIRQQFILKDGFSMSLVGVTHEIETEEGTIYVSEDPFGDGGNSVNYTTEDYSIDIAGSASVDEILSILQYK